MHNQRGGYLNPVNDYNYLERKCEQLDKEIDQLVYQLYELTEEEIKIVENK